MLCQPVICEKCPLRRKRAMHKIDPLLLIFFCNLVWRNYQHFANKRLTENGDKNKGTHKNPKRKNTFPRIK